MEHEPRPHQAHEDGHEQGGVGIESGEQRHHSASIDPIGRAGNKTRVPLRAQWMKASVRHDHARHVPPKKPEVAVWSNSKLSSARTR